MKTIVVSDLHLTDKFEPKKFAFLQQLFSSCDKLIVNGDLWCGFSTTFEKFINSRWKDLFPLMLEKQTVYIHGNHDRQELADSRVNLFCKQIATNLNLHSQNTNFKIFHGHEYFKLTNPKTLNVKKIVHRQKIKKPYYALMNYITLKFILIKKINKFLRYYNKLIYKKSKQFLLDNQIIVIGHTHVAEFRPDRGYINTGFIMAGHAWYLEIDDLSFRLLSAKY